jgi:hypothetical protein
MSTDYLNGLALIAPCTPFFAIGIGGGLARKLTREWPKILGAMLWLGSLFFWVVHTRLSEAHPTLFSGDTGFWVWAVEVIWFALTLLALIIMVAPKAIATILDPDKAEAPQKALHEAE